MNTFLILVYTSPVRTLGTVPGVSVSSVSLNKRYLIVLLIQLCVILYHVFSNRKFAYPRLAALVVVQWVMVLGLSYYAMGLAGQVYIVAISMGLGFGAHWSIALSATSELFGLKNFGTMFNFLAICNPIGSLFFSGFVASKIYDYYAEQQAKHRVQIYGSSLNLAMPYETSNDQLLVCEGNICFSLTCGVFAVLCTLGSVLSLILVHRTKKFYAELHRKSLT